MYDRASYIVDVRTNMEKLEHIFRFPRIYTLTHTVTPTHSHIYNRGNAKEKHEQKTKGTEQKNVWLVGWSEVGVLANITTAISCVRVNRFYSLYFDRIIFGQIVPVKMMMINPLKRVSIG